jgi:hypothetical protein
MSKDGLSADDPSTSVGPLIHRGALRTLTRMCRMRISAMVGDNVLGAGMTGVG